MSKFLAAAARDRAAASDRAAERGLKDLRTTFEMTGVVSPVIQDDVRSHRVAARAARREAAALARSGDEA